MATKVKHIETPPALRAEKERRGAGGRPQEGGLPRPWLCRNCGREATGRLVPAGWYTLARHTGRAEERPVRLGAYCCLDCLQEQMPRLLGIEGDTSDGRWQESPFRQRPTR